MILVYGLWHTATVVMTLSVLEGHSLLQAFSSSAIFHICGASRGPSASAELLVLDASGSTESQEIITP